MIDSDIKTGLQLEQEYVNIHKKKPRLGDLFVYRNNVYRFTKDSSRTTPVFGFQRLCLFEDPDAGKYAVSYILSEEVVVSGTLQDILKLHLMLEENLKVDKAEFMVGFMLRAVVEAGYTPPLGEGVEEDMRGRLEIYMNKEDCKSEIFEHSVDSIKDIEGKLIAACDLGYLLFKDSKGILHSYNMSSVVRCEVEAL